MQKFVYERIFKNWKSSAVGIGLMASGLVMVYLGKATLEQAMFFVAGGVALFFAKDK